MSIPGLDAWITGGRASSEAILVHCPSCEEYTQVVAETDYGQTYWSIMECSHCSYSFNGDESYEIDDSGDDNDDDDDDDGWTAEDPWDNLPYAVG